MVKHLRNNEYIFLLDDITQLKKLQEELEQSKSHLEDIVNARTIQLQLALEIKSRFLAVMSHEIRTPLSGILGSLSLLSDTTLNNEQQDILSTAQVCGEQLLYLINDILGNALLSLLFLT